MQGASSGSRRAGVAAVATFVMLVAGCGSTSTPEEAEHGDVLAAALAEAREGGAAQEQVAALEAAVQTGGVSVETAREAVRRAIGCMTDVGLDASYTEKARGNGLVLPGYLVVASESDADGNDPAIDQCVTRESYWIDKAYQLQPSSIERNEDFANQQESVLRMCLEQHGSKTDAASDGVDLANQSVRERPECLHEAGIDAW